MITEPSDAFFAVIGSALFLLVARYRISRLGRLYVSRRIQASIGAMALASIAAYGGVVIGGMSPVLLVPGAVMLVANVIPDRVMASFLGGSRRKALFEDWAAIQKAMLVGERTAAQVSAASEISDGLERYRGRDTARFIDIARQEVRDWVERGLLPSSNPSRDAASRREAERLFGAHAKGRG